jgi:hypothetical protein
MATAQIPLYSPDQKETFYVPAVEVYIRGQKLKDNIVNDILQVTYKDSINEIDSFNIEINNWEAETRAFKFTPPVGINLYVVQGLRKRGRIDDVIIGAAPFVLAMMLMIVLLSLWPMLALWLPRTAQN